VRERFGPVSTLAINRDVVINRYDLRSMRKPR
jgi:hypothetical protein